MEIGALRSQLRQGGAAERRQAPGGTVGAFYGCLPLFQRLLAIRLAAALVGSAESWLRMQVAYELWQAQKKRRPKIQPINLRAA